MIKVIYITHVKAIWAAIFLTLMSPVEATLITPVYDESYIIGGKNVTDAMKSNFNAAVDLWETALPTNNINLKIPVKLSTNFSEFESGLTTYEKKDNTSGFITEALIEFNNFDQWFFDPTPNENSEFDMKSSELNTNSATTDKVNSGRFGDAILDAAKNVWDFLSVAVHEIGHALGIGFNASDPAEYVLYENEVTNDDINIDPIFAMLFPNNQLPVLDIPVAGSHFDGSGPNNIFDNTLLADPGFQRGMRSNPSDLDILAVGSVYNLGENDIKLNQIPVLEPPTSVPEPATISLLLVALFGWRGIKQLDSENQANK